MKYKISLFLILIFTSFSLYADDDANYRRISLSADASGSVNNDTMIAVLFAQEEGNDTAEPASRVNKAVQWAVQEVKRNADLKVEVQSYNTHPVYRKNQIVGWRVKQSIQVESRNAEELSDVLGKLQSKLSLDRIYFSVSTELRRKTEDLLIAQAIDAFKARAALVTKQFDARDYQLVNVNVGTTSQPRNNFYAPQVRMEAMMVAADRAVPSPAVEAGESELTVNVNGQIELK